MEPHRNLVIGPDQEIPSIALDDPHTYFRKAKKFVETFYRDELERISSISLDKISPDFFFREYIWVVHATGFSAKAVGKFLESLLHAYGTYESLANKTFDEAFVPIKPICNNPQKSRAIWKTAQSLSKGIEESGWDNFKNTELSTPGKLSKLPYIGNVTCFHLGRNIGLLDCVKPDLHLIRMAEYWKYNSCVDMCKDLSNNGEIPLGIVDLILWYSASHFGTLEIRKSGSR